MSLDCFENVKKVIDTIIVPSDVQPRRLCIGRLG